jgi:hypothetical protein
VALILGLILGSISGLISGFGDGLWIGLVASLGVGLGCWSKSPLKNGIISGLIVGGLIAWISFALSSGVKHRLDDVFYPVLLFGLIFGLIGGLGVGSLNDISPVETLSWKWNQFWKRAAYGSIFGLIVGVIVGLVVGLILWLSEERSQALDIGQLMVLICPVFGGLVGGLIGGFTNAVKAGKASPNQGIRLSWKNSLAVFLVFFLIFGLFFSGEIAFLLRHQRPIEWITPLLSVLIFGFIGGLNRGGSAVIKHYALRLVLWWKGYTPLNFIKFLDHCDKLILLKKVGGGYIFIHRMLLEYFAELTPESTRAWDTTTGSR